MSHEAPTPASPDSRDRMVAEMAELAGGLAHELRNPLSTLMINLKLLSEDLANEHASFDLVRRRAITRVESLRHEAQRLQNLFEEFLRLATPCALNRHTANLHELIQQLMNFLEPSLQAANVVVNLRLEANPHQLHVDEDMLRQALLNLIINGQQAMPEGGQITVATRNENSDLIIEVFDTGVGIAKSDHDRILRPFYSTKKNGNGLGLSITRRIIEEHGGTLTFDSQLGKGTTFHVRLPIRGTGGP